MTPEGDVYGRRTLDFVERLQKLKNYDEICVEIQKELEWFGLTCVTAWSMPGPGRPHDEGVLLNTRPAEYIENYKEKKYLVHDRLITEMRETLSPYSWKDVQERRKLSKLEQRIIDEGREFDVHDGLIIPIVTLSGSVSRRITAPAPTNAYSPSVTPQTIVAFAPIDVPRLTNVRRYSCLRDTCERGFMTFVNTMDGPQNTSSSSSTPS